MIPKKVIVVGAGGIGTHFIPTLARLIAFNEKGVAHEQSPEIMVIDGDIYEEKNQNRQLFPQRYIGKNKAEAMCEEIFGLVGCAVIDRYIDSATEFAGLCVEGTVDWGEQDVILICMCVDNDATRRMVYDGIRDTALNFIVVDMANEKFTGDVTVCGRGGGEWLFPWPVDLYPNLANPGDRPPQAYCTEKAPEFTQIVTANMAAANVGAEIVRKILGNEPIPMRVRFDFEKMSMFAVWE